MNTVSIAKSRKTAVLSVRTISMTAMLSAVAYLLAFVEFSVPLSPSFAGWTYLTFRHSSAHLPLGRSPVCSLNLSKTPCSF